jgi:CheY-like chemotaxis protein
VLLNLVGNAIKFTERGLVRVSLRRPPGERRHSMVEFSVEDTGIGIPAEKLDSIFTDFQQADASTTRRYGGTGLGLTISRKLIALMGGRLDVESDVGVGSRFSFSLSLQRASQEQPVARPPSPNANALAGLKLLVVEDMPLNQEVAKHLLTNAGADVTVAESGSLAIDLALAAEPPFDAVLMDLQMPGMDGLETTRRLRATPKLAATPIIAMTANIMASDKQACLEAGMNDHVGKPFHIADMIAAIQAQQPPRRKIIPLVTVKLALHRLAGDKALFIKIARQLKDDLPPMLDQLADAVTRQVPAEGVAVMHKLKSLAGVVGAGRLAAMAAEFEAALKAGATGIDLFALRDVLAETSLELGHVVTSMKPAPRSALCTSSLAAGFAELDGLLQARNMRALDISASIEESLRDIPGDPFAVVSQAVDKLDFVAARKALRAMVFEAQAG